MPARPLSRSQVLDHFGLVAAMFDELGLGDVIDHATHHDPQRRALTAGEAVKAMVLNGLGLVHQALSLVPLFFHTKPTFQLISSRVTADQRNDDALGRAVETLSAYGVTALYTLLAASAANRLGLGATYVHLDSTSCPVDGRYNGDDPPAEHVVHLTQGSRRDHRPDLNQVMVALLVEHQAGIPVLMKPLSGNSRDAKSFAQTVSEHIQQVQSTYGTTYLVADRALYSAETLGRLQDTHAKGVLCQKGLPLRHERFAVGPARDHERLLGELHRPCERATSDHADAIMRPVISQKRAIDPKVGRIVAKVCREKSVSQPKIRKTPRNFVPFLTARVCFRFATTAKLSDNVRTPEGRPAIPSAGAAMLCSLCFSGSYEQPHPLSY